MSLLPILVVEGCSLTWGDLLIVLAASALVSALICWWAFR